MTKWIPEEKRSDPECQRALKAFLCTYWLRKCDSDSASYAPCQHQCVNAISACNYSGGIVGCKSDNKDCTSDAFQLSGGLSSAFLALALAMVVAVLITKG
eukprot:GEZU01009121.1.p1 GENE.GEZU01009121.1~~GEZU01009121.1.p1  ORF type:complete len:100 (-),score=19.24 GEZU01009121.1:135-434(-)